MRGNRIIIPLEPGIVTSARGTSGQCPYESQIQRKSMVTKHKQTGRTACQGLLSMPITLCINKREHILQNTCALKQTRENKLDTCVESTPYNVLQKYGNALPEKNAHVKKLVK